MHTVLPALPLAERLPADLTAQQHLENLHALADHSMIRPSLVAKIGWAAVERHLGNEVSEADAQQALDLGRGWTSQALEDGRLLGGSRVHASLLGVFLEEFADRRSRGPELSYQDTVEGLLTNVWGMVRGARVHSLAEHRANSVGHELCFPDESSRSMWSIELAALALTMATEMPVYPASARERQLDCHDERPEAHQIYVVLDGVKVPARIFRSTAPKGIAPGVARINWKQIISAADGQGTNLTEQAMLANPSLPPLDAAAQYVLDGLLDEHEGTIPQQWSEALNAAQEAISLRFRATTC